MQAKVSTSLSACSWRKTHLGEEILLLERFSLGRQQDLVLRRDVGSFRNP